MEQTDKIILWDLFQIWITSLTAMRVVEPSKVHNIHIRRFMKKYVTPLENNIKANYAT